MNWERPQKRKKKSRSGRKWWEVLKANKEKSLWHRDRGRPEKRHNVWLQEKQNVRGHVTKTWFECSRSHWKVLEMSQYALIHNTVFLWCYWDVKHLFSSSGSSGTDACPWGSDKSGIYQRETVLRYIMFGKDTCLACWSNITSLYLHLI